jgi:uncharacterized protein
MLTRENAIKVVEAFAKEIIATGFPLDKVILFGSYANGTPHVYSDIDVALFSPKFIGFGFEDRKFFSKINIRNEFIDIETQTYPTEVLQKENPFVDLIQKTGIEVSVS